MASLPTAYAGQRFGRRTLDYYAAAGEVIGADPRARSDERRLQDFDGARHTVRLMESGFSLEPGDQASVLRMQPGPARRSRPVAVINHTQGGWSRTHPGASGLLARAGIARTLNWTLTVLAFVLASLAVVWPYLRTFLVEIDPALFGAAPQFDVFALAVNALPALADWRLADVTSGLAAQAAILAPGLEGLTPHAVFTAAVLFGAVVVHALRSWRLIWAPVFIGAVGAGALGFDGAAGAVTPALAGLGLASGLFLAAGLFNRIRDAARLERRIAVLADHILRNPPEEMITATEAPGEDASVQAGADDALEPVPAAAAAAAYRSPEDDGEPLDGEAPVIDEGDEADAEDTAPQDVTAQEEADETSPQEAAEPDGGEADAMDALASEDGAAEDAPSEETLEAVEAPDDSAEPLQGEAEALPDSEEEEGHAAAEAVGEDPADAELARIDEAGEDPDLSSDGEAHGAPRSDEPGASTFEQEETERLRTDPRYASRAIVLPPPPPMPGAATEASDPQGEDEAPVRSQTRTLQPGQPLPSNVVPMFAAPAPDSPETEPAE